MRDLKSRETQVLHITNDKASADKISEAGIPGNTLAWQDALYEGPVIDSHSLNAISTERADYFARIGWGSEDEIQQRFSLRNQELMTFSRYKEVTLWFDHDLYDQLQLVQLIDWFSRQETQGVILNLICIDGYSGVKHFLGIGQLELSQLQDLYARRSEITVAQMDVCEKGWKALTAKNPNALLDFFPHDMSSMPFLKNAIARLVKQFPSQSNGLSQTESLILTAILNHQSDPEDIYQFMQSKEAVPFMSRAMFYGYLKNMMDCQAPLIEKVEVAMDDVIDAESENSTEQKTEHSPYFQITLTDVARQVLHNWVDWIQVNGIDRWVGGVHLSDGNIWRYNKQSRKLTKTYV